MLPKKRSGNAAWAVSAALIAVILLFLVFFLTQNPAEETEGIVLPSPQDPLQQGTVSDPSKENEAFISQFLEITDKNVLSALQSLSRPVAYHQIYKVTVGSEEASYVCQVVLWVKGSLLHAEISDGTQVRKVISDGSLAYIWYDNDESVIMVELDQTMRMEDILGLPDFDSYLSLDQSSVVDSEYLILEDQEIPCIYVCAQQDLQYSSRYWVNLNTGLLYQSDVLENSSRVYEIQQQFYEGLALEDEAFRNRFLLPDGSDPFSAASKMLQP